MANYGSISSNPAAELFPQKDDGAQSGAFAGHGGSFVAGPVVLVRKKNWPICKPFLRHDISGDIPLEAQAFVTRCYLGWYAHIICLCWNFISLMSVHLVGPGAPFAIAYSLLSAILGPIISFGVYYLLYSSCRTQSAFKFGVWMFCFAARILAEIWFFIGVPQYGCSGMYLMAEAFEAQGSSDGAFMVMVSMLLWGLMLAYDAVHLILSKRLYNRLGGLRAARKQAGAFAATSLKEVVTENQDAIKQAVIDNREAIAHGVVAVGKGALETAPLLASAATSPDSPKRPRAEPPSAKPPDSNPYEAPGSQFV